MQKAADSALPPDRKLKLYILARFNVIDNLVRQNKYIRYDFIFNNLRVEQLRKGIDMKERQLLTRILQNGKEQGLFNINNPSSFAKTLLIMFDQTFCVMDIAYVQKSGATLYYHRAPEKELSVAA